MKSHAEEFSLNNCLQSLPCMQVIGSTGEPVTAEVQHGFPVMAAYAFQIQVWLADKHGHDIQAPGQREGRGATVHSKVPSSMGATVQKLGRKYQP